MVYLCKGGKCENSTPKNARKLINFILHSNKTSTRTYSEMGLLEHHRQIGPNQGKEVST